MTAAKKVGDRQPVYHNRELFGDQADFVTYGARLFLKPLASASYWMVPGTFEDM